MARRPGRPGATEGEYLPRWARRRARRRSVAASVLVPLLCGFAGALVDDPVLTAVLFFAMILSNLFVSVLLRRATALLAPRTDPRREDDQASRELVRVAATAYVNAYTVLLVLTGLPPLLWIIEDARGASFLTTDDYPVMGVTVLLVGASVPRALMLWCWPESTTTGRVSTPAG